MSLVVNALVFSVMKLWQLSRKSKFKMETPHTIIGRTLFIGVQQCFSDWCLDLAEELEIEIKIITRED